MQFVHNDCAENVIASVVGCTPHCIDSILEKYNIRKKIVGRIMTEMYVTEEIGADRVF